MTVCRGAEGRHSGGVPHESAVVVDYNTPCDAGAAIYHPPAPPPRPLPPPTQAYLEPDFFYKVLVASELQLTPTAAQLQVRESSRLAMSDDEAVEALRSELQKELPQMNGQSTSSGECRDKEDWPNRGPCTICGELVFMHQERERHSDGKRYTHVACLTSSNLQLHDAASPAANETGTASARVPAAQVETPKANPTGASAVMSAGGDAAAAATTAPQVETPKANPTGASAVMSAGGDAAAAATTAPQAETSNVNQDGASAIVSPRGGGWKLAERVRREATEEAIAADKRIKSELLLKVRKGGGGPKKEEGIDNSLAAMLARRRAASDVEYEWDTQQPVPSAADVAAKKIGLQGGKLLGNTAQKVLGVEARLSPGEESGDLPIYKPWKGGAGSPSEKTAGDAVPPGAGSNSRATKSCAQERPEKVSGGQEVGNIGESLEKTQTLTDERADAITEAVTDSQPDPSEGAGEPATVDASDAILEQETQKVMPSDAEPEHAGRSDAETFDEQLRESYGPERASRGPCALCGYLVFTDQPRERAPDGVRYMHIQCPPSPVQSPNAPGIYHTIGNDLLDDLSQALVSVCTPPAQVDPNNSAAPTAAGEMPEKEVQEGGQDALLMAERQVESLGDGAREEEPWQQSKQGGGAETVEGVGTVLKAAAVFGDVCATSPTPGCHTGAGEASDGTGSLLEKIAQVEVQAAVGGAPVAARLDAVPVSDAAPVSDAGPVSATDARGSVFVSGSPTPLSVERR